MSAPETQAELDQLAENALRSLAIRLGPRFVVVVLVGDCEQRLRVTSVGNAELPLQRLLVRAVERSHQEGTAAWVVRL